MGVKLNIWYVMKVLLILLTGLWPASRREGVRIEKSGPIIPFHLKLLPKAWLVPLLVFLLISKFITWTQKSEPQAFWGGSVDLSDPLLSPGYWHEYTCAKCSLM